MNQPSPKQYNTISRTLVIYVVLFSSIITVVLTALQLYNDYRYDRSLIDRRLSQIEISNMAALSRHMWTLNHQAIQLQLDGLLKLPDIVYVEVTDPNGNHLASAGLDTSNNVVSKAYFAAHEHRGTQHQLGQLRAVATLDNVYQRLLDKFVVILITQGVKTFLVSAFIIFIVARLITRHLHQFSEHARQLDLRSPGGPLRLNRRPSRMNKDDELEQMVNAYNAMQDKIRDAYAELTYSQRMLERAQEIAHLGSWEIDTNSGQIQWSNEARSILAYSNIDPERGFKPYIDATHAEDRASLIKGLQHTRETGEPLFFEQRLTCGDGKDKVVEFRAQLYREDDKRPPRLTGTIHDVTEHCRQRNALRHLANFDSLTGLPNRWSLSTRLEQTIASNRTERSQFALALIDLDGFKEVNDSLGHHIGDELLSQIKPRLDPLLRQSDTLARLGGDEFAILLNPIASRAEAIDIINAIADTMTAPFDLEVMQVQVGVSIGITTYPDQASDAGILLRYADVAMYHAKRNKLQHTIYSPEIDPHTPRRLELISDMRRAIEQDQLILYYQPKVFSDDGRLDGAEALVRWRHPAHGMIRPDEFIPLCEISDIIRPLTLWVMDQALADCQRWQSNGFTIGVSVNVSVRNLLDNKFPDEVMALLSKYPMRPSLLTLEITESALMEDPKRAKRNIDRLNTAGVKVSIDDFGTGYSSLSYLKHLPVHELKIDRGFISDMLKNENDAIIVRSTIELAHGLGLSVTAEGVEDAQLTQRLRQMGCDRIQGYHIARPMPFDQLKVWLADWPGLATDGTEQVRLDRASN